MSRTVVGATFAAAPASEGQAEDVYVSVVVPIYNEEDCIPDLLGKLTASLERVGKPWEIICVDDGSRDDSFDLLRAEHARDGRIKAIRFRRNFGQTPAFTAGFDAAAGKWIVTIDADLQNDPDDIPAMLTKAEEGFDIVSGWRTNRQEDRKSTRLNSSH